MTQLQKAREEIKYNEMLYSYVQVDIKPVWPFMPLPPERDPLSIHYEDYRENLITNSRGEVIGTKR